MELDIHNIFTTGKSSGKVRSNLTKEPLLDILNKEINLFKPKFSDKKKENFYSELSILLSSGIDIRTSFEILIEEQTQLSDKELFSEIYKKIIGGESLSESLINSGKFTQYEYYSLKIGEESGRIKDVLVDLTTYYSKKLRQRRQIVSSFTYPVLVIITAIIAVFFMLRVIVPMFSEVFKRFNGELPAITKLIISFSNSFGENIIKILIVITCVGFLIYLFRNREWFRRISTKILLNLPLFGKIASKIYLAKYCQSMSLLIGSKTPMLRAINLVKEMLHFYPYEQALGIIEMDILNGKLLSESMIQFEIFDKRIVALTRVAEEVNQLNSVYAMLSAQYSEELEHQIALLGNLLEPLMIVFVGLLVGFILISMYLPLFQLSTNII
jgi:type IV pilus assembly protein PilC